MINPIIYACSSKEFKNAYCRILKCRCQQTRRRFRNRRHWSMNTSFSELKGSFHGSPKHSAVNHYRNGIDINHGDEAIKIYQYSNGGTNNSKEVSSGTLKSDYEDYPSGHYDQDQIDALRMEQMERNHNTYNIVSEV